MNQQTKPPNKTHPGVTEEVVLGTWSNRLRVLSGLIAVGTTCLVSYIGIDTVMESVKAGKGWPSDWTMLMITVPPTAIAWQYMSVNKLLSLVFSANSPEAIQLKDRLRGFLDPKVEEDKPKPDKGDGVSDKP